MKTKFIPTLILPIPWTCDFRPWVCKLNPDKNDLLTESQPNFPAEDLEVYGRSERKL